MVRTDPPPVVSDAGPIIHLDELECLDLLLDLGPILVPRAVWLEVLAHRHRLSEAHLRAGSVVDVSREPSPQLLTLADSLNLDRGERAALALMEERAARLFLCDDAAARLAAESLGFAVHGTLGILVRSIRRRLRSREAVLSVLHELPRISSLHVAPKLLGKVIAAVEADLTTP